MDSTTLQCASQSVGPANQLIGLLIQTILSAHCSISPSTLWPEDYGPKFINNARISKINTFGSLIHILSMCVLILSHFRQLVWDLIRDIG